MLTAFRARLDSDEAGFSLIEVSIVLAVLLVVMGSMFSVLVGMTRTETRASALVDNEQHARAVLTQMARELRQSNPMGAYPTIDQYRDGFQVTIGKAPNQTTVRWLLVGDPTSADGASVRRDVLDTATGTWDESVLLRRVRSGTAAEPMFRYTSRAGTDLLAAGNVTDVANCTIRVKIFLRADSSPGPEPYSVQSDVHLRNKLIKKDATCP